MLTKAPLFYDTNCFEHLPRNFLETAIKTYDNKILSSVVEELREHLRYSHTHPDDVREIDLVFDPNEEIREEFQIIDIGKSYKTYMPFNTSKHVIKFKRNPIICSSYYHLLPLAYNPSFVLDPYGHVFNYFLHLLNHNLAVPDKIVEFERKLKSRETQLLSQVAKSSRTLQRIDPVKLMRVYKKKIKLAQQGKVSLTDVQLIVTALLYCCFFGKARTCVLTADRDLVMTTSTLMLSIFEKYVLNDALEKTIDLNDPDTLKELREKGKVQRRISLTQLHSAYSTVIKNSVKPSDKSFEFVVLYYRVDTGELIPDIYKIPVWLRNFILEFKGNVDCYSLNKEVELKYQLSRRKYDPSKSAEYLYFDVFPRREPFYNGFLIDCEKICQYAQQEQKNPSAISDFDMR